MSRGNWQTQVSRHIDRIRRERLQNVVVDDIRRGRVSVRRAIWRAAHDCSPNATPIYVVGLQRSGTNMLLTAFAKAPEAEIYNESRDSRAFYEWLLREDEVVRSLIESSRHRCIVFKPLGDIYRLVHLMEGLGAPSRGRSIWIYRGVDDRARSVLAKWPESVGVIGRRIASGFRSGPVTGGLSEERLAWVDRFDPDTMTPASGAALFWYLRNIVFFDLELEQRPDVALISYDRFVVQPERLMVQLCEFAGIPFRTEMIAGIARRPPPTPLDVDIDPELSSLCADLRQRLDNEFDRRLAAGTLAGGAVIPTEA